MIVRETLITSSLKIKVRIDRIPHVVSQQAMSDVGLMYILSHDLIYPTQPSILHRHQMDVHENTVMSPSVFEGPYLMPLPVPQDIIFPLSDHIEETLRNLFCYATGDQMYS